MLKVDNISLYYGAAQALRGVSLSAEPGKVTCVLGRNGGRVQGVAGHFDTPGDVREFLARLLDDQSVSQSP